MLQIKNHGEIVVYIFFIMKLKSVIMGCNILYGKKLINIILRENKWWIFFFFKRNQLRGDKHIKLSDVKVQ